MSDQPQQSHSSSDGSPTHDSHAAHAHTCLLCLTEERTHIETVVIQRFNYLIVFFGVILVGSLNVQDQLQKAIVLLVSSLITFLIGMTIERAHVKLRFVMDRLYSIPNHPASQANRHANLVSGSRQGLVGVWIPAICAVALLVLGILALVKSFDSCCSQCSPPPRSNSCSNERCVLRE